MEDLYKYSLEKGSKKYKCPVCGKKRFVLYMNNETKNYVNEQVGRCDREQNCGYHKTPKQLKGSNLMVLPQKESNRLKTSYLNQKLPKETLRFYERNNLVSYLEKQVETTRLHALLKDYHVGTSKHWEGATVFWQIDKSNRVRTGKIMLYDKSTGKRIKEPFNKINWVHRVMKNKTPHSFNLKQCLFGEHLINNNSYSNKDVAVVESEKTALMMAFNYPKYLWLSCGSLVNINKRIFEAIQNKETVLFPDKGCYAKWKEKAALLNKEGFLITISSILEESNLRDGDDIADLYTYSSNEKALFNDRNNDVSVISNMSVSKQNLSVLVAQNSDINYLINKFNLDTEE